MWSCCDGLSATLPVAEVAAVATASVGVAITWVNLAPTWLPLRPFRCLECTSGWVAFAMGATAWGFLAGFTAGGAALLGAFVIRWNCPGAAP
jgi:hypothetical protein